MTYPVPPTPPKVTIVEETLPEPAETSDGTTSDSIPSETVTDEEKTQSTDTGCSHEPILIPAVDATCTQAGSTEGSKCGSCGIILTPPSDIPAKGHDYDPANGYKCTVCGVQAICSASLPMEMEEVRLNWGDTLALSWQSPEETLFPVLYMVTAEDGTPLWDTWRTDTNYTRVCTEDGEILTLQILACYAYEGQPIMETLIRSAVLTAVVEVREALESPAFPVGNAIAVDLAKDVTVQWMPASADGADIAYDVTLTLPDGKVTALARTAETVLTIPAEVLIAEGDYTLSVTVLDESNTYRESLPATLAIRVRTSVSEEEQDFTNPSRYASDYFYNYLATQSNGQNLQRYYRLVDTALTTFHSSYINADTVKVSGGKIYYSAAKLDFTICGLTLEEAVSVRFMYLYDHPLYYWISNSYVYNSTSLYFCVFSEYASGEDRARHNAMVYEGVESLSQGITAETTAYSAALAYYERLLGLADYAYETDGETPQDDPWAHSIIGVFNPTHREVVCEGFAKAYGLLLNYHGVENIPVPGLSRGVGHLWNLLRLDDGEWYWCDITWDDTTHSPLGTDHKYFCVNDTQDVLYYYVRDGIESGKDYTFSGSATFMDDHTIHWDEGLTLDMSQAIPPRAQAPYDGAEMTLRESFTVDGMTYALTGYGTVQLISVGSRRSVTIPATVTYEGVTYTVSSVGLMREDGVFMTGRLLPLFATSVYISENVSYIWDGALDGLLVSITVSPDNPWYTVENGVIKSRQ